MYDKVLIPTLIGDKKVLKTAIDAANRLLSDDGEITLLHVVEEIPTYIETYVVTEALDRQLTDAEKRLNNMSESLGDNFETKVIRGHAGRSILDEAKELESDLVIISSHQPGLADYFLGSTAGHVVRHAHSPVLVLR